MSICPLEWDDESKIGSKLVKGGKVGGMKGGGLDSEGGGGHRYVPRVVEVLPCSCTDTRNHVTRRLYVNAKSPHLTSFCFILDCDCCHSDLPHVLLQIHTCSVAVHFWQEILDTLAFCSHGWG